MRSLLPSPVVAQTQQGVFTRRQAVAEGFSYPRIRRLVSSGAWCPVVDTAFVVAGTPFTPLVVAWAAYLLTGGSVSHSTAMALWGRAIPDGDLLHVTVSRNDGRRASGVRRHTSDLDSTQVVRLRGLPITSRVRTITDCLATVDMQHARELMFHALRERWMTHEQLLAALRARTGRPGAKQLLSLVRVSASNPHSEAEAVLHRLLRSAGLLGWLANVPVRDSRGLVGIVDVLFPRQGLVIEVDGRAYHGADRFQADRTRQNRLVAAGYTVLRFTWDDLTTRPEAVIASVRETLAAIAVA